MTDERQPPDDGNARGWIKIHRRLLENPRASNPNWVSVWLFLMLTATHRPMPALWCGKRITLMPGQLIVGRKKLAEKTGVSESAVRRALAAMKNDQQIDLETGNKSSLITVRNWNVYQNCDQQNDAQPASKRPATRQQPPASDALPGLDAPALQPPRATVAAPASKPAAVSDADWLNELQNDPAYTGLDVPREHAQMVRWCDVNRKKPSRRRFINWLNHRERPMVNSKPPAAAPLPGGELVIRRGVW